MKYREFGTTGFEASEIGLGAWQLGGDWGEVTEEEAYDVLTAAFESGVNFIDTADVYGSGRSERLIGTMLRQMPGKIFIATKLGQMEGCPDRYSLDVFRRCTGASRERLGVESLDLTQLHCIPKAYLERGEVFDWLRALREEGLIRHFGASVESMEEALLCLRQDDLTSLQIIFNIFRQTPKQALFRKAREKNVALIIRLPLASGLLAGKFTTRSTFSENDHRNYNRDGQVFNVGETFAGLKFERGVKLADRLRTFVPENMTMAECALRWILDHEEVSVVIPGAKNRRQVLMNAGASRLPMLPEGLHERLSAFYEEHVKESVRGPD